MSKNKKMLLIYAFMLTIGQILVVAIISGVEALGNKIGIPLITEASGLVVTNMAVYLLLLIAVCLLFGNELRKEWQQEKKQIVAQIVKYGVVFLIFGIVVARTAEWLGISTTSNQETLMQMIDAADWFSSIIIMGIAAPIIEEIIFRYIIMGKIYPNGKKRAVIISSVLFGMLHLDGFSIAELFIYTLLGIYLGIIYNKTKKITVPIGVHCFYNLVNVLLVYILVA
ncbi:MAG: CPBP family intramembrane metalloprotease [Roseburia sp.]|nr:CPBP family intramembrane metalloprotease [Roseburia sp.]